MDGVVGKGSSFGQSWAKRRGHMPEGKRASSVFGRAIFIPTSYRRCRKAEYEEHNDGFQHTAKETKVALSGHMRKVNYGDPS